MSCQKKITQLITTKKALYMLTLKGNQGSFYDQGQGNFALEEQSRFKGISHDYYSE